MAQAPTSCAPWQAAVGHRTLVFCWTQLGQDGRRWCFYVRGWLSQFLWIGTWCHMYSSIAAPQRIDKYNPIRIVTNCDKLLFYLFEVTVTCYCLARWNHLKWGYFPPYKYKLVVCWFVGVRYFSHVPSNWDDEPKLFVFPGGECATSQIWQHMLKLVGLSGSFRANA